MPTDRQTQAWQRLQEAYRHKWKATIDRAVELYPAITRTCTPREAHTFLGWTFHFQGRSRKPIAECKRAIEVDPEFGNPYNDIGAYLIGLDRFDERFPGWSKRLLQAI